MKSLWQQAMLHGKPDLQQYKESKMALKTLLERNTCELMKVDLWQVELVLVVRLVITDLENELGENGSFISSLKCVKYICNYNECWRKQRALIIQKRKKKKKSVLKSISSLKTDHISAGLRCVEEEILQYRGQFSVLVPEWWSFLWFYEQVAQGGGGVTATSAG